MSQALEQLDVIRQRGEAAFEANGLPTRRVEAWRYTPVQALSSAVEAPGFTMPAVDTLGEPADGLKITSLSEANTDLPEMLFNLEGEHPSQVFSALNDATLADALVIRVAPATDGGRVNLDWNQPGTGELMNARVLLILEEGARLKLTETYRRKGGQPLNVVIQVELSKGAKLLHSRLQADDPENALITRTIVEQAGQSRYQYTGLDLGGGLVRHDLQARLSGEGAHCDLDGAYLPEGRTHVDNHLEVEHRAPNCSSSQFFRGVMADRSRAVFNGRVHVHAGADGTEARQSNQNLLLSEHAEVNTKPELEILADEVVASHGATVGQLDEEAVFYLRSRGLDEASARNLLTTAFCQAVIDRMQEGEVRDAFRVELNSRLGMTS